MSRKIGNYGVIVNGTPKKYFLNLEDAERYANNTKDQIFGLDDTEILDCNTGVIWII